MRISRLFAIALLATATIATTGCKKDKKEGGDEPAAKTGGGDKPAAVAELDAAAFYKDFNSLEGMAVIEKYEAGVIVSGKVLRTITEESGKMAVWLDSGEGTWVSLDFKDEGKAAKDKGVKEGDTVKAHCQVGGSDGAKYVMNIDCELK